MTLFMISTFANEMENTSWDFSIKISLVVKKLQYVVHGLIAVTSDKDEGTKNLVRKRLGLLGDASNKTLTMIFFMYLLNNHHYFTSH